MGRRAGESVGVGVHRHGARGGFSLRFCDLVVFEVREQILLEVLWYLPRSAFAGSVCE